MLDDRPLAEPWREEAARRLFPYREMSAERYAARWAHTITNSSFDQFFYSDPNLTVWIDTLHDLIQHRGELERCRRLHLTPEEYEAVQAGIAASNEAGL